MVVETWEELFAALENKRSINESYLEINDSKLPGHSLELDSHIKDVHLRFCRVKFTGDLRWNQVFFDRGATFIDVDFEGEAHFHECVFLGPAYFWKCRFQKAADFSNTVVQSKPLAESRFCPGETNFSYSEFYEDANFRHAVFQGKAWFWRTVFRNRVDFEVVRFEAGVHFASMLEDICVSDKELELCAEAIEVLRKGDVLTRCGNRTRGYYNFHNEIDSADVLRSRLKGRQEKARQWIRVKKGAREILRFGTQTITENKVILRALNPKQGSPTLAHAKELLRLLPLPERLKLWSTLTITWSHTVASSEPLLPNEHDREKLVTLWNRHHNSYMFSDKHIPNFMEAIFGPDSWFRHISFRKCLLRRADLSNVHFDDARWNRAPRLAQHRRQRVYDEVWLRSQLRGLPRWNKSGRKQKSKLLRKESGAISGLYNDLRRIADTVGERRLARGFYFGEMETARLAERWWRSILAYLYKLLSGYGTHEYQALAILLVLMFGFFPSSIGRSIITWDCFLQKRRALKLLRFS